MASEGSVSGWIELLKAGDQAAAQPLWERYFHRLVGLAKAKLPDGRRRAADEEDVALSAFNSFCQGAEAGRFPQLTDRDDLWRLLITLTARKAFDQVRDEHRLKRGGGNVLGQSALQADCDEGETAFERFVGREPTPESAALVAEECRRLLACLNSDELRTIAVWKMEGHTNAEIATKLDCALTTVERKLQRIRMNWEQEVGAVTEKLPLTLVDRIDEVCDRFEREWKAGNQPKIDDYLDGEPGPARESLRQELMRVEAHLPVAAASASKY